MGAPVDPMQAQMMEADRLAQVAAAATAAATAAANRLASEHASWLHQQQQYQNMKAADGTQFAHAAADVFHATMDNQFAAEPAQSRAASVSRRSA